MRSISESVDAWIVEEELAVSPRLKVVGLFDGLYPDDPEESEAYWDFMDWFLGQEDLLLRFPGDEWPVWRA